MVVDGGVVNAPSDGRERPIADGLLVYSDTATPMETVATQVSLVESGSLTLRAGDSVPLQIADSQGKPMLTADILWSTGDGLGFVNQRGVFTSTHAGAGVVTAHVGVKTVQIPVQVLCGPPAILKASLTSIPNYPAYYNQLSVSLTDKFGNPVEGAKIAIQLDGGELSATMTTDSRGTASSQVVWDVEPALRIVRISSGSAPVKVLKGTSVSSASGKTTTSQDPDNR